MEVGSIVSLTADAIRVTEPTSRMQAIDIPAAASLSLLSVVVLGLAFRYGDGFRARKAATRRSGTIAFFATALGLVWLDAVGVTLPWLTPLARAGLAGFLFGVAVAVPVRFRLPTPERGRRSRTNRD